MFLPTFLTLLALTYGWSDELSLPPVLPVVARRWEIPDSQPIHSVVTRVHLDSTQSKAELSFGLEKNEEFSPRGGQATKGPLPFTIDPHTGVVFTNQSLDGRGGEDIFLYVTVSNGDLVQKTGVWATILDTKQLSEKKSPQGRPPSSGPQITLPTSTPRSRVPIIQVTEGVRDEVRQPSAPYDLPNDAEGTKESPIPSSALGHLALTVLPITILLIASALLGITAFIFRKRLCKNNKNTSKEEMKKKNSSGEDPLALHQWTGPRGITNRYTPWETHPSQPETLPQQTAPGLPAKGEDRWEFPRHHLKVLSILGEGCFGQVWKSEAINIHGNEGTTIVAVKTLKENAGDRERSDLLKELEVMKSLEPHPNVVRLLGCCTEKEPYFVIMEYVGLGKLQSFLRSSRATRSYSNLHGKSGTLTSRQLTTFCYQVAKGMEFLSGKGIIHRDLAARNILLSADHSCKVADFGFARDVIASHIYERKSEGRLPIRWMAPESLYDNIFSVKSDIWSFGVLMWEIVTLGSTPYPGLSAQEVMRQVKEGVRLDKPEHCKREVFNIMFYCWDPEPEERPDFGQLVLLLEELLLSETDYIELQRFPDHSYYNMLSLSGEKV